MAQSATNQIIRMELRMPPPLLWSRLCERANDSSPGTPRELPDWLDAIRFDAEAHLNVVEAKKKNSKAEGATTNQIKVLVRSWNDSAVARKSTLTLVGGALGGYRLRTTAHLNTKSGKFERTVEHAKSATNKQLIAFALCVAIDTGAWRHFRRCQKPECNTFFYDHKERGKPSQRYCCDEHQQQHAAKLRK